MAPNHESSASDDLCDVLGAYVPMDRRQAMASGKDLPLRTRGAALFADISGFTELTEALEQKLGARHGSEELTAQLNAVYRPLIAEVDRYRGSVIGFSGDAISCWFDEDEGLRAAACGLRLQQIIERFGTDMIGIKVSVAAGLVRRFVVGDPMVHVLDVMCGSPVDRMATGERLAGRGELVVATEVADALASHAEIEDWRNDGDDRFAVIRNLVDIPEPAPWPRIERGTIREEQLRPWLLPPVYQTLRSGHSGFLADLRQCAALFLRFEGIDFERDESADEKLDLYVRFVQDVLKRYEGSLIQLTIGDKGSYLYAAFGAPIAHEDAVDRALAAALLLRELPPHVSDISSIQIGISAGRMRTGAYGSEARRTYGVLGDETNVAARLMTKAASGQILVSAAIARGTHRYQFASLGEIELKGKRTKLPVFELHERLEPIGSKRESQPAHASVPPLVGRHGERVLLLEALERMRDGQGGAILVEGEPGIGKSHLIRKLVDAARSPPAIRCLLTSAEAIEASTPLYAWRHVFAQLLEIEGAKERAEIERRLRERLPEPLHQLFPLLSPVLAVDLPDTARTRELRGDLRTEQTLRLLAETFAALTENQPVLLVIEDIHWLDSLSLALIERLTGTMKQLLLAATTRVQPSMPEPYQRLKQAPSTRVIRLEPLAADQVDALVAERLGVDALPPSVAQLLRDKAEGNPFFAVELGYALRDAGFIRVENGVCEVARSMEGLGFPDTIEGVVTSRIDRLEPLEQLTLKVASVLGRAFDGLSLRELFPVADARPQVADFLSQLQKLELTSEERREAAIIYMFRHAITQDVAYNLMLFEQRRALHDAAADWYERTYARDLGPYYALLAHHRLRALEGLGEPDPARVERALKTLLAAGKRALTSGATIEAARQLEKAASLLSQLPSSRARDALELDLCTLEGAALAVVRGPTHESVRRIFTRASELCETLGETGRLFEAIFGLWFSHATGCERAGATEYSSRLMEIASASTEPGMRAVAHHAAGCTAIIGGRLRDGLANMEAALALLERSQASTGALAETRNTLMMSYCYRAWAHQFLGFPDSALEDCRRAIVLAKKARYPLVLAQALSFQALVHRYRGEPAQAQELVAEGGRLAAEHGIPYWNVIASAIHGWLQIERGDLEAGARRLAQMRAREREAGIFSMSTPPMLGDLIDAWTRLGRFDEARSVLEETKQLLDTKLIDFAFPEILRLEGELHRHLGEPEKARACYEAAVALARRQDARWFELRALVDSSRLAVAQGGTADPALAETYRWFDEGHETRDLRWARELIGEP